MATGKTNNIDNMNMVETFQTMQALGVSFEGVETLSEMKSRVRTVLDQADKTSSWSAGQVKNLNIPFSGWLHSSILFLRTFPGGNPIHNEPKREFSAREGYLFMSELYKRVSISSAEV